MIETIYIFIIFWIMAFLFHEFCHLLEAIRQGTTGSIRVWTFGKIPSFIAYPDGELKNPKLFALAGGFYSGLLLLPIAIFSIINHYKPFDFIMTTLSAINICYSFFEMKYLYTMDRKRYMIFHYLIYLSIIIIMIIIFFLNPFHFC